MLGGKNPTPDLTHWVNQTRHLVAYDRKLKNAVSQSIGELLAREGIDLSWRMSLSGGRHLLTGASAATRCATHLGKTRLTERGGRNLVISEALHGGGFVAMAAALFDGRVRNVADITTLDLSRVDWQSSSHKAKGGSEPCPAPPARRKFPARTAET